MGQPRSGADVTCVNRLRFHQLIGSSMRALVFGVMPEPQLVPETDNHLVRALATTPMRLEREHSDPRPLLSDWVVTKPLLTGICGSDSKQVFMDWGDETRSPDNPMKSFFLTSTGAGPRSGVRSCRAWSRCARARTRRSRGAQPLVVVRPAWRVAHVHGVCGDVARHNSQSATG